MAAPAAVSTAPSRASIIPCLSGLRGVAALAVVYLHQNSHDHGQKNMGGWDTWGEFGHIAVIFFFVLSAFLLTYRGLYDFKRKSDVKHITLAGKSIPIISLRWISYFIRRLFRIYPCYMATILLATLLPRFQGDDIVGPDAAYYVDFSTNKAIPPREIINYFFLYDVKSIFWTIPPEIEYYFVIPFIVVTFEIAQSLDESFFFKKDEAGKPLEEEHKAQQPLSGQVAIAITNNFKRCLFRTIHILAWSALALPGVLDSEYWVQKKGNEHHLPRHFFRFWTGSFVAIILYLLERNNLVPTISAISNNEKSGSFNAAEKAERFVKRGVQILCDLGCWWIVVLAISTFPWYQGNYFGVKVPKVDPEKWPQSWCVNTTYVYYHGDVFDGNDWHDQKYSGVRSCAYMCGLLVFLICFGARKGTFSDFFLWKFFTWCGEVSFPIYLTHLIALREYPRLWKQYFSPTPLILLDNVIVGMIMSVFVASIMHFVIERPCMKAGAWLVRFLRKTVFKPTPAPPSVAVILP